MKIKNQSKSKEMNKNINKISEEHKCKEGNKRSILRSKCFFNDLLIYVK